MGTFNDKVVAGFGRHEAPVLSLKGALFDEEAVFILAGLIPNLKGHPLVHRWFGCRFKIVPLRRSNLLIRLWTEPSWVKPPFQIGEKILIWNPSEGCFRKPSSRQGAT